MLLKTLAETDISIEITDAAADWLAMVGFDPIYGARPIKRALQRSLLNELSKKILSGEVNRNDHILVDSFGEGLIFRNKN